MEFQVIQREAPYPAICKIQEENHGETQPDGEILSGSRTETFDSETQSDNKRLGGISPLCLRQTYILHHRPQAVGNVVEMGKKETPKEKQ